MKGRIRIRVAGKEEGEREWRSSVFCESKKKRKLKKQNADTKHWPSLVGWLVFIPSPSCLWREESAFLSFSLSLLLLRKKSSWNSLVPFFFSCNWSSLGQCCGNGNSDGLLYTHTPLLIDMEKVPSPWISMPQFLCPERPSPTHPPSPKVFFLYASIIYITSLLLFAFYFSSFPSVQFACFATRPFYCVTVIHMDVVLAVQNRFLLCGFPAMPLVFLRLIIAWYLILIPATSLSLLYLQSIRSLLLS